ncbi:Magnesium transporter NIPA [Cynara cardunculus var. scolymus]|uniref:Probable magnesium transporter n=1 Tax=Cynara cardunculus var. scolymus TaxID=59895 RepID=A0A103Y7U7_CYNCS|nr:Magnesium transporter NIPA [Cynara cardunculus var. scolymus]
MGVSDNSTGLILAVLSSGFIGTSFILKKKGLKRAAASTGFGAVIVGEAANFVAYAYAPAVLVTPLGALSIIVVSIKAIGIAIKLTLEGVSQVAYPQTWVFVTVAVLCVITQLNYLNKALDTFNTAIVSPIYYVMFTSLTIVASVIMFKDWKDQSVSDIASEICGFITVLSGTIVLHSTREQEPSVAPGTVTWYDQDPIKTVEEDEHLITIHNSDYFD